MNVILAKTDGGVVIVASMEQSLFYQCGCQVLFGFRTDNGETAMLCSACPDHKDKMSRAWKQYRDYLIEVPASPNEPYHGREIKDIMRDLLATEGLS